MSVFQGLNQSLQQGSSSALFAKYVPPLPSNEEQEKEWEEEEEKRDDGTANMTPTNFVGGSINFGGGVSVEHKAHILSPGALKRKREAEHDANDVNKRIKRDRRRLGVLNITKEEQCEVFLRLAPKTKQDVLRISTCKQLSEFWHDIRKALITGSRIGAAIGVCPYTTTDQLLCELLWPKFRGNAATAHGQRMEPVARKSFLRIMRRKFAGHRVDIAVPGINVSLEHPWLGYSPDGILLIDGKAVALIEIKAPFKRQPYDGGIKGKPAYYAQTQLGMWSFRQTKCYFVMYCGPGPNEPNDDSNTHIELVERDEAYIYDFMMPRAHKFYTRRFLPMVRCRDRGYLRENQVYLPIAVQVEKVLLPVPKNQQAQSLASLA